jgi:hypothetical protein
MKTTIVGVLAEFACLMAFDLQAQARAPVKVCLERASIDSAYYPNQ